MYIYFYLGVMLVGNKYDLKEREQIIPHEKIVAIARTYNWKFNYCSAKNGYNIQKILDPFLQL